MKNLKTNLLYVYFILNICLPQILVGQENNGSPFHEGFYLRFLAGGGPGSSVIDNDMTFKSSAGLFHFQIGGEISENLVLFGDIGGFSLSDPKVEFEGTAYTLKDVYISSFGVGIGLSYYIMPANIYLTGSLMLANSYIEYQDQKLAESERGPGVFLSIGKEWWVGKKWGLGIAGFFEGAWLKDKEDAQGYQADINNQIFGIAFSATMF